MATSHLELRSGLTYDFMVTDPVVLTLDVGQSHPEPGAYDTATAPEWVSPPQLDTLLQQWAQEAQQLGTPARATTDTSRWTLDRVEKTQRLLWGRWNEALQGFLEYVKTQAHHQAQALLGSPASDLQATYQQLQKALDVSDYHRGDWQRQLHEDQTHSRPLEAQDQEWQQKLQQDWQRQPEPTLGSHLAQALSQALDQRKHITLQDLAALRTLQQQQTHLWHKLSQSYLTFYSWLLEQWNRNTHDLNQAYAKVQQRIQQAWSQQPVHNDVSQLVQRYEAFLKAHEASLPLEFTLSANPRHEWKTYLATQQPEECIRLMRNELRALDLVPQLQPLLQRWLRELDHYDVAQLQKKNQSRQVLRKRMEDAVETETRQTCERRWSELTQRIYKLGTQMQTRALQTLTQYQQQYAQTQHHLLRQQTALKDQMDRYERRLALVDQPWAAWLEQRKRLLQDWSQGQYNQVALEGLLQIYDHLQDFQAAIQASPPPTNAPP